MNRSPDIGRPSQARILLVDPVSPGHGGMAGVLSRHGYTVELTESAREAFVLAQTGRWDAVVINPGLPEMKGVELYTRLHRDSGRECLPVIFVSGHSEQQLLQALQVAPRASQPVKPPGVLQFLDTLEQCLEVGQEAK
jgi:CheY-like chemotaxis protein